MTLPCQLNEAGAATHRAGVVVVLCGPDGSGKSSIASALIARLRSTFPEKSGLHCHWKPWAKNKAQAKSANSENEKTGLLAEDTRPHDKRVRSMPISLFYFGYHWLTFYLGMLFTVPRYTRRGGLVLIERFYYDFFIDQHRYRLHIPRRLVAIGYRLLPKPDLVFLLDAPADVLQKRKKEVSLAESARQRDAYRNLISKLPQGRILDATESAENVVEEIARQIQEFVAIRDRLPSSALERIEPASKSAGPGGNKP